MKMSPFKLEEFWKQYEFITPHLLCCSDAETWGMQELLSLADPESLNLWNTLHLGYTEPPGHPLLRAEIAQLYSHIKADNVLTFTGAEEGIYCVMQTLLQKGDHVIVIDPCYQSLATLPKTLGADVTTIPLKFENQWQLDLKEVQKAFRKTTKLLVLNYPHNPTGALLTHKVQEGLISLAREQGAYIFSDEVYRYLEVDETKRLPSLAECYEKGIALNVMSKSFGLAGLRLGWVVTQDRGLLSDINSYKLYTTICNSAPSEILTLMGLRAREHILQRNRKIMLTNLHLLDGFIARNPHLVSWVRPQSGTVALLKLKLSMDVETFMQELVRTQGILIMPGSVLDLPGNFFRIGFGKKNMPGILERFEQFLQQHHPSR